MHSRVATEKPEVILLGVCDIPRVYRTGVPQSGEAKLLMTLAVRPAVFGVEGAFPRLETGSYYGLVGLIFSTLCIHNVREWPGLRDFMYTWNSLCLFILLELTQ